MTCATPVPDESLTRYWLDDLEAAAADRIEDHAFACVACGARLRAWATLIDGLWSLTRSAPPPVLSERELEMLRRKGTRIFDVRIHVPVGRVVAAVPDWAEVCVLHLPIEPAAGPRVDLVLSQPGRQPFVVIPGIVLEPGTEKVLIACTRHVAVNQRELRFVVQDSPGGIPRILADCILVNDS